MEYLGSTLTLNANPAGLLCEECGDSFSITDGDTVYTHGYISHDPDDRPLSILSKYGKFFFGVHLDGLMCGHCKSEMYLIVVTITDITEIDKDFEETYLQGIQPHQSQIESYLLTHSSTIDGIPKCWPILRTETPAGHFDEHILGPFGLKRQFGPYQVVEFLYEDQSPDAGNEREGPHANIRSCGSSAHFIYAAQLAAKIWPVLTSSQALDFLNCAAKPYETFRLENDLDFDFMLCLEEWQYRDDSHIVVHFPSDLSFIINRDSLSEEAKPTSYSATLVRLRGGRSKLHYHEISAIAMNAIRLVYIADNQTIDDLQRTIGGVLNFTWEKDVETGKNITHCWLEGHWHDFAHWDSARRVEGLCERVRELREFVRSKDDTTFGQVIDDIRYMISRLVRPEREQVMFAVKESFPFIDFSQSSESDTGFEDVEIDDAVDPEDSQEDLE